MTAFFLSNTGEESKIAKKNIQAWVMFKNTAQKQPSANVNQSGTNSGTNKPQNLNGAHYY